ncbi:MAG TPA: hypothetical protein P5137_01210, partial [Candidatus Brocadiia bacterium]|nr:hypothetical protein [Candidatus Brocadiia bacterium]
MIHRRTLLLCLVLAGWGGFGLAQTAPAGPAAPAAASPAKPAEPPPPAPAPETITLGGVAYTVFAKSTCPAYDAIFTLEPTQAAQAVTEFDTLAAASGANAFRLRLAGGRLQLSRLAQGKETELATAAAQPRQPGQAVEIIFRRRAAWLAVLLDGVEQLRVLDASPAQGAFAVSSEGQPLRLRRRAVRPFAPIDLQDDFMRTEQDQNPWETLSGAWRLHTVRESALAHPERQGRNMDAAHSANYFSYEGQPGQDGAPALCASGDPHASDYEASLSVKTQGGSVGLAVHVLDKDNCVLLRWRLRSIVEKPCPMELVSIKGGKETVLARAGVTGAAGQWYRLALATAAGRLTALVDGTVTMDVPWKGAAMGRVGLYAADGPALFDDISVVTSETLRFDTAGALALATMEGRWRYAAAGPNPIGCKDHVALTPESAQARLWLGPAQWPPSSVQAVAVPAKANGALSLLFDTGAATAAEMRLDTAAGGSSQVRLLTPKDGRLVEIAAAPVTTPPGRPIELRLDATQPGVARAYVDGRLLFAAPCANFTQARPGLAASGDIVVRSPCVSFRLQEDASQVVRTKLFAQDPYMVGWASVAGGWEPAASDSDLWWHKSDFYGPLCVYLPVLPKVEALLAATETQPESGYVVALSSDGKKMEASLRRAGKELAKGSYDLAARPLAAGQDLALSLEGGLTRLSAAGAAVFSYFDPHPPRGSRVGVRLPAAQAKQVQVTQYDVKDYLFTQAPADWFTSGVWEVTNRFACDPRWSWLSATGWNGVAAAWNKREFDGDQTIEFYAGMRMQRGMASSYPRPGEINVSLCGDGRNLDSGYSVIINGWDPQWTGRWSRIMRAGREVAAAYRELVPCNRRANPARRAIPVSWDPGGRPIHGAWYYVKVRRIGGRIEVYFDDALVMAYDDPKPLQGKRMAIWTMDNSIVIARTRISYTHTRPAPAPVFDSAPDEPPQPPPVTPVASSTHPGACCPFEESLDGWRNPDADQGADLSLDTGPSPGQRCLKLLNIRSGGTFGAALPIPFLDLASVADLRFKYRIPPDVRVNLYFLINETWHFIHLTGPDDSNENMVMLGRVSDVVADGKWREASFDMGRAVRETYPAGPALLCNDVRLGCYHPGYTLAGFNGNAQNATYWIDDFRITTQGCARAVFDRTGGKDSPVERSLSLTPAPADPGGAVSGNDKTCSVECPQPGLWFANIKTREPGGAWRAVAHIPILADPEPLRLQSAQPANGAPWGGGPIRVEFAPLASAALNLAASRLLVNTTEAPLNLARWDRNALILDLSRLRAEFNDGQKVSFSLTAGKRRQIQGGVAGAAQTMTWEAVYSFKADKTPPSAPSLSAYPLHLSSAEELASVQVSSPAFTAAIVESEGPQPGDSSLRIVNRKFAGNMSTLLCRAPLHAGKAPILAFDYAINPMTDLDWGLILKGHTRWLRFTDQGPDANAAGRIPDVVDDGQWRSAEVNIRAAVESLGIKSTPYAMTAVQVANSGYCATAPGAQVRLANIRIAPARTTATPLQLTWTSADTSGIAGYAYTWDANPRTVPAEKILSAEGKAAFSGLSEGKLFFHVRGQDKAGIWGPTAHYQFLIDNTAPQPLPAANRTIPASEEAVIRFVETGSGIDESSLAVSLEEPKLKARPAFSTFRHAACQFAWEWTQQAPPSFGVVPDGQERVFHAGPVADFAGNTGPESVWRMVIKHKDDKLEPPPPVLTLKESGHFLFQTFDNGETLAPYGKAASTHIRSLERRRGDKSIVVAAASQEPWGVTLVSTAYDLGAYPWLTFDYRIPPRTRVGLLLYANGDSVGVNLTVRPSNTRHKLSIPALTADDTWRHVAIPIGRLLGRVIRTTGPVKISSVAIIHEGPAKPDECLQLDNVCVLGPVHELPSVTAAGRDLTGIQAFAWKVDADPFALPGVNEPVKASSWKLEGLGKNLCYLHVRAQDGAGNWGPAAHV